MPSFSLSSLVDSSYLFDIHPASSSVVNMAVNAAVVFLLLNVVVYLFIKRAKWMAGVHKVIVRKWAFRNLIITAILLLLLFFRNQGFKYLSMRVLPMIAVIVIFGNLVVSMVMFVRRKAPKPLAETNESVSNYQDYLPKKKKK
jgi:amino acid transporter